MIKKLLLLVVFIVITFFSSVSSDDSWSIIPEVSSWDGVKNAVKEIWKKPWKVWETYNKKAKDMSVWDSFASWVFTWDTITDFLSHIAKSLSWIALVISAFMIIYAWYKYASWVFTGDASKWWKDAIKWAISWLLVVIFSYAIIRLLLRMFWWI